MTVSIGLQRLNIAGARAEGPCCSASDLADATILALICQDNQREKKKSKQIYSI